MQTAELLSQLNGVDLGTLGATVDAIAKEPALGHCRFRARNRWVNGTHNRTTVTDFFGAGEDVPHKQPFELLADEPAILAGADEGANPVEHLLHALASCVTTSMIAHAAVRGIAIESLESELEGDIDLNGFLGLDADVPRGFTNIRVTFRVGTDRGNLDTLKELGAFSPVYNTLINGVKVDVDIQPA